MLYKILFALLILFLLTYYMPVKMIVKTIRKNENDVMAIRLVCLYGLLKLKYEIPYMDLILRRGKAGLLFKSELKQPDEKEVFKKSVSLITTEQVKKMLSVYENNSTSINKALSYTSSKLKVYDLSIIYKIGTGDAATTALVYGISWIIVGSILSILYNFLSVTTKDIVLKPVFDVETFNIELSCIITLKLGHIINTGIKLLPVLVYIIRNNISFKENTAKKVSTAD